MKNTPDIRLRSTDAAQAGPGAAQVRGGAAALEPARGGEPGAHGVGELGMLGGTTARRPLARHGRNVGPNSDCQFAWKSGGREADDGCCVSIAAACREGHQDGLENLYGNK